MTWSDTDRQWMKIALDLAARGEGLVEPNPMVGCVIVRDDQLVGQGWHQRFGGPHAEVEALSQARESAAGAVLYVTLEPCCHHGKTPPCVDAILAAGVKRVVIAEQDPFPLVAGGGIARLRQAGLDVAVGLHSDEAHDLNAPFHTRVLKGRPWVIAKWAMSLDGKIATRTGDSQWISNESSRAVVHQLRGRMDAILVGRRTVLADNPQLTARPVGLRVATRIVLDSAGHLPSNSQLARTASQVPVLVVTGTEVTDEQRRYLTGAGCEVFSASGVTWPERLPALLSELGRRGMTNLLIEGGAMTLGGFFDQGLVDEVHVFLSARVIGGASAPGPVGNIGIQQLADTRLLRGGRWEILDGDLHYSGRR